MLRITHRGRHVSRRCFVAAERKLILPAFGALTGGLDARHPDIVRAERQAAQALVPVANRLLRFPIPALQGAHLQATDAEKTPPTKHDTHHSTVARLLRKAAEA